MKKYLLLIILLIAALAGYALLHKETSTVHATCRKGGVCNACKNCKYCKNCSQNGGTCSVCR
ncbi:hypothetical protein [Chitinophaga sp. CF118]|uniref:hypothetical protein n=1 Tax=Chitinophaga sp. CF118 TaxID=1884367 RepID=UPI001160466A|nr:hypothetical protein [Chitinophaga sp. CF118]